jgi:hypothetical protein
MSLSRLWLSQGKKKEAHRMLTEISGWFTEGWDTKDLQEAKTLLEELTSRATHHPRVYRCLFLFPHDLTLPRVASVPASQGRVAKTIQ